MMKIDKNFTPHLAIVKITDWFGSGRAEHLYADLIFPELIEITTETYGEWAIDEGEDRKFTLKRELTEAQCMRLDKKDGGHTFARMWYRGEKLTHRFDTFLQVKEAAEKAFEETSFTCPLVYMYHGDALTNDELNHLIATGQ